MPVFRFTRIKRIFKLAWWFGGAPVYPPHGAHQLDGPGSALHVGGHVKYEEESENRNILKFLIVFNCVILKRNVGICLAVSVLNK